VATFSALYEDALHTELGTNDTSVLFTGARRKHAVNEGLRQFADLTECLVRQSTITATSNVQEYNLNSTLVLPAGDYLRVASQGPVFQTSDSNGLTRSLAGDDFLQVSIPFLDHAQSGWRSTVAAYPTGWYLRSSGGGLFFGLTSPLSLSTSSTETAQIILQYVANPSSLTADTSVPYTGRNDLLPYHQALVHYAAHDLEKLRKDWEASDRQLKKFQGYVQRYLDAHRPKGSRTVRAAVSYFRRARGGMDRGGLLAKWW
jgi:hypothetical protein